MNSSWIPGSAAVDGHQIATLYRPASETVSPLNATDINRPVLVFLHGITSSIHLWPEVLEGSSRFRGFDCLSVSLPGHWPSTAPTDFSMANVTPDFFVRMISAAINASQTNRPVILIGWSTGGYSALALAADAEFKRQVLAVISLSGFARGTWRGWLGIWQHLAAWKIHRLSFHAVLRTLQLSEWLHVAIASSFLGQPGNMQLRKALSQTGMHDELQQHTGSALQKLMGGIRSSNLTNRLSSIQCPVTIINGLGDPVIPAEEARHLHQHIPTSTLTLLDNVGHMLLIEAREEVLNQVEDRLRTILK